MWCLVTLPNSVVLEIEVDAKALGQECLEKICHKLGVIEEDYFGLQYHDEHGELLWLNTRNALRRQISGPLPIRLRLCVKFFVPPHLILQETTRHQFYLQVKEELLSGKLKADDGEHEAKMAALMVQAESGDVRPNSTQHSLYPSYLPHPDAALLRCVAQGHLALKGMEPTTAEYRLLQEASRLDTYGVESFYVKESCGRDMHLGVGPEGIALYDMERAFIKSIPYSCICLATHTGKCFYLQYLDTSHEEQVLSLRLDTSKLSNSLYRSVTEKHAFYSCDTVRNAVTAQFIRDLKGTIASLFNENTALGKKYVFDIRRTCREVYDSTRRTLHQGGEVARGAPGSDHETSDGEDEECHKDSCKLTKERMCALEDAMLCRVCMCAEIQVAFLPCGHVTCCQRCAARCDLCPICRSAVDHTQFVYLPTSSVTSDSVSK